MPFSHLYLSSSVTSCHTLHMAFTPTTREEEGTRRGKGRQGEREGGGGRQGYEVKMHD